LLAQLPALYEPLYQSEKAKAYDEQVRNLRTTTLFDGFLEMVVSGDVADSMKDSAGAIGQCLARKALEARNSCELREPEGREAPVPPTRWKLGLARATCGLFVSNCWIRRGLFAAAYPTLLLARQDPKVLKLVESRFEELFPVRFLSEFKSMVDRRRAQVDSWVAPKLGASRFSSPASALIQDDDSPAQDGKSVMHLDGFALGLQADLASARVGLQRHASVEARNLGAAGFWAAVQRLLVLSGMKAAEFRGESYVWGEPPAAGRAPTVGAISAGGWSVFSFRNVEGLGPRRRTDPSVNFRFEHWDWEQYARLPLEPGTVTRLIPHALSLDSTASPGVVGVSSGEQRLEDLALLMDAVVDFLSLTQKEGALAKHFGTRDELANLFDPSSPVLFPKEIRLLGYGILGGIFRNLLHPDIALVVVQSQIEPGKGLGIRFYESASLFKRSGEPPLARTVSLARLILAAARLRELIVTDHDSPLSDSAALLHQLDSVIQIGALTLGSDAQVPAGGFRSQLASPELSNLDFDSTVLGLRAIQEAYLLSGMSVLKLNLAAGFRWLKACLEEKSMLHGDWSTQQRVQLWHWISLWDRAQPEWRDAANSGTSERDWGRLRLELEQGLVDGAYSRTYLNH
jgi:hypothetical protein